MRLGEGARGCDRQPGCEAAPLRPRRRVRRRRINERLGLSEQRFRVFVFGPRLSARGVGHKSAKPGERGAGLVVLAELVVGHGEEGKVSRSPVTDVDETKRGSHRFPEFPCAVGAPAHRRGRGRYRTYISNSSVSVLVWPGSSVRFHETSEWLFMR